MTMKRFEVAFHIDITDGSAEDVEKWLRDALTSELILYLGERIGVIEVKDLGIIQE